MRELERALTEENLKGKIKTIIGGGATSKELRPVGSNAWAGDAVEAVKVVESLVK